MSYGIQGQKNLLIKTSDIHDKQKIESTVSTIRKYLSEKDIYETDFRILGSFILYISKKLSNKTYEELLIPISDWLHDEDWIKRVHTLQDQKYDWSSYKRQERKWTKQQKQLAADRLKHYRLEIIKKRNFKKDLKKISVQSTSDKNFLEPMDSAFVENLVSPFSPLEQHRHQTKQKFSQAMSLSVSNLLPWKLLLREELFNLRSANMIELKSYYPESRKRETVSKLMHLLELEKYGEVQLTQQKPFGDVIIKTTKEDYQGYLTILDEYGEEHFLDWHDLNLRQKEKVIDDIKTHKILCIKTEEK